MIFGKNGEYRCRFARDSDYSQIESSIAKTSSQTRAATLHKQIYFDSDGSGNWVNAYYEWPTADDMFNKNLQENDRVKERLIVFTDSDESEIIFWAYLSFVKKFESSEFYKAKRNAFGICDKFRGNPVHRTGKRVWDIISIDASIALKQPDFLFPVNEYWGIGVLDEDTINTPLRIKPTSAVGKKNYSLIKINEEIERVGLENFKNDRSKFRSLGEESPYTPLNTGNTAGILNIFPYIWNTYDSAEAEYL